MSSTKNAILFLTSWYPVKSNPNHGIFIQNHAIALSKFSKVIVVYAYSATEGPFYDINQSEINDNLIEYRIKYSKSHFSNSVISSISQFIKLKKAHELLLRQLIREKYVFQSIQVNVIYPVASILFLYKRKFNVKHSVMEHWSGYLKQDGNYKGKVVKSITEHCVNAANKIGYVSEWQKKAMIENGLKGNYQLIYNAVNTDIFKPLNYTRSGIRFLHVSSLVEREKNISGLLQAIHYLQNKNYDFEIVIIGGNKEELEQAKLIAQKLNLVGIVFKGLLSPTEVAKEMNLASVLLLPSFYEGMPVVVLEALSCGLPVIASNVGQLKELINKSHGILIEPGNNIQLEKTLEEFITNKFKFDSIAMREFVEKFASYNAVGKQLCELNSN